MATVNIPSQNFASVRPLYRNSTSMSISKYNFTQQVYSWRGRLKVIEITLPVMERDEAQQWVTFFRSLKGHENTFYLNLSDVYPGESGVDSVLMRLADPEISWSITPPLNYEFSFTAMEAI